MTDGAAPLLTAADLADDLRALGVCAGDTVMAHAAMRSVGRLIGGPDTLIAAIRDVVGPAGTLMVATDWHAPYLEDDVLDADGRVAEALRPHIPPFDAASSRSMRDNGAFAEWVRTTPGARRSANPGCSMAAIGARADWLTADHPPDYGYGPGSPLARLVAVGGRVLMVGAPDHTMTLLHHAEHLADVPGKRVVRQEMPLRRPDGSVEWRINEEYESTDAIVEGFDEYYFDRIVADYRDSGAGRSGRVGNAASLLVEAADVTAFAVRWIERAVTAQSSAAAS